MQRLGKLPLVVAAVAICLLALATREIEATEAEPIEKQGLAAVFGAFKLPKLFDFEYYQERYGKRYANLQETLARKAYFMARALRAYVSGMNFKWRIKSYFLAVNHLSDSSPQEKERRRNKVLAANSEAALASNKLKVANPEDELPEFLPAKGENVEQELRKLAEANPDKPGYRELLEAANGAESRRKREVTPQETRDFSLDQLMTPGIREPVQESPGVAAKIKNNARSNNPYYQQPEAPTRGLSDNHEGIKGWTITDKRPIDLQLKSSLDGLENGVYSGNNEDKESDEYEDDGEEDIMYFDHRDSDCITKPRNQGDCGACYAFASTALMEWLYCVKTDLIVPFSEQYMIDCGLGHFGGKMAGCNGGLASEVFRFIQNFGLERLKTYPYLEREGQCLYEEEQDVKETGYIRMDVKDIAILPVSLWNEYIEYGPLYTSIASPLDYEEYKGGVHDGHNCAEQLDHAQLVVGHGREDGKDFWLIKNSYGAQWGEGGYFKLSKDAPERCIGPWGYALGTKDAIEYNTNPYKNSENKRPVGSGQPKQN